MSMNKEDIWVQRIPLSSLAPQMDVVSESKP
jgi:hypothetical protein